jgi:hypothetical protein
MKKNSIISALTGTFALALVAVVGCTDSAVDTGTATALEKYSAYDVNVQTLSIGEIASVDRILEVGAEFPAYASTLAPDSSSCGSRGADGEFKADKGRGGKGQGRGHGHGPKGRLGLGELIPKSFRRAIDSLNLTAEQDSAISLCFRQARQCGIDAQQTFLTERRSIDSAMRPSLDSIRTLVKAGTMTKEEARTAIGEIKAQYASRVQEMNTTFKASLASCRSSLDGCIRGNLTEDQLVIWIRITGGTI